MIESRKKTISLILLCLAILAGTITVTCASLLVFHVPMSGTIPPSSNLQAYFDCAFWTNGSEIAYNPLIPGEPSHKPLAIHNTGNTDLQVHFVVIGLPLTWDITYTRNGTIVYPGNWLNGTVTVTPNGQAQPARYTWDAYIKAN